MALIIFILAVAAGVIQTAAFKRKLAVIIENQGSEFVNGKLSVGSIEGNFFSTLALKDILVADNPDTLIYIEAIEADYRLWPLLRSKLVISSATITRPFISAKQLNDSVWNLQTLLRLPDTPKKDTTRESSFEIDVARFVLVEGIIKIESQDSIIPQKIKNLNTDLSLFYSKDKQSLTISSFGLNTEVPDLIIANLSLHLMRDSKTVELKDFYLKTALNEIKAEGKYNPGSQPNGFVRLSSAPLMVREFDFLLPGFHPRVTPALALDAIVRNDSLMALIKLEETNEDLLVDLSLGNLGSLISTRNYEDVRYKVTWSLNQITLADWIGIQNLDYILNGTIWAEGTGIKPETAVAQLKGEFSNSVVEQRPVDRLDFAFDINHGNLSGNSQGSGTFGEFEVYPEIRDFLGKRPFYTLKLLTRHLNLAELTGNDTLQSKINLKAEITGRGFDPKYLEAQASIMVDSSGILGIKVDTLFAKAAYSNKNLMIDSLLLLTETIKANGNGNYSLHSYSDMVITASISSLDEFNRLFSLKNAQARGNIEIYLHGPADSLNIDALLSLGEIEYDSIFSDTIALHAQVLLTRNDTLINAALMVGNLWNKSVQLDSVTAKISARRDSAYGELHLVNHQLNTYLSAGVNYGNGISARLEDLIFRYKNQEWALNQQPALFMMDSGNYTLTNFDLVQNKTNSDSRISANGTFSTTGTEDFKIELTNIDIAETAKTFYKEIDASGNLNLLMQLQGSATKPILTGEFEIINPVFNKYKISEFDGNIDYRSDWLKVSSKIVPQDSGRIELSGEIPLVLRLDSIHYRLKPSDSIDAKLTVSRFPLAVFQALGFTDELKGYIDGNIFIDGTIEKPEPHGRFELQEAAMKIPKYGIDYRKIDLAIDFLSDRVNLDTLNITTSDGKMTGSGQMNFGSAFYKGDISNTNILITFDRFNPVDHRQFNMEVSGDATLTGKKGEVVIGGDLNIPESEIYLPFVMNMLGKFSTTEMPKPILIRELQKRVEFQDSTANYPLLKRPLVSDTVTSKYFENFTGKINIKIPKNSWIKNEDFRIELSGDLELLKNKEFFEIFGTVDVIRGQYDLFGKTFIIDEGTVSFQGGEEIKPEMNIKASYAFRNVQRIQQKLSVRITGTVSEPKVSFTLDDNSINEGDALSFILFGKGLNELSMSQQENMSAGIGPGLAQTSVSSILTSQITKFLGKSLNVDYIEIKSDGSFENATVTVGKYITNNLFVNYEQQFGETTRRDVDRYRVDLEYELFKFLFIQLNNSSRDSGFNIIIKLESK